MLNLHLFLFNCFSFPAPIITFVLHRNLFKFFYSSHKVTNLIHLTVVLLQWMKTTTTKQPFKFIEKCKLHSNHQFIFQAKLTDGLLVFAAYVHSSALEAFWWEQSYIFSVHVRRHVQVHMRMSTHTQSPQLKQNITHGDITIKPCNHTYQIGTSFLLL